MNTRAACAALAGARGQNGLRNMGCVHYTFSDRDLPVTPVPTLWPGALALMGLMLAGLARRRLKH